jgi:hypothetical protein
VHLLAAFLCGAGKSVFFKEICMKAAPLARDKGCIYFALIVLSCNRDLCGDGKSEKCFKILIKNIHQKKGN